MAKHKTGRRLEHVSLVDWNGSGNQTIKISTRNILRSEHHGEREISIDDK